MEHVPIGACRDRHVNGRRMVGSCHVEYEAIEDLYHVIEARSAKIDGEDRWPRERSQFREQACEGA